MAELIFYKGKEIILDNPDGKTSVTGDPVEFGGNVFLPIGTSGISIIKFDSINSNQEIGRWGIPTDVFPSAEKPPFRPTIFISKLKISGEYIFAFDLNLPIVYILRAVSGELSFVNYVRAASDFSDRPKAKERSLHYMIPLYVDSASIQFIYNIDIQKIFVDQNDVGEWMLDFFYEKINYTYPPNSFNEFNLNPATTDARDLSLATTIMSLPSITPPFNGIANEVEIDSSQEFFYPLTVGEIFNTNDATHNYSCFNIKLQKCGNLFKGKDNRLFIIKNLISGDQNSYEIFSPVSFGIGSNTKNNSPMAICESNGFIFIACNKSGLKRFTAFNPSILHANVSILDDDGVTEEDVISCATTGNFIYLLTKPAMGRMLRVYFVNFDGSLNFLDRTSFTGTFQPENLYMLESGEYLLSHENVIQTYNYSIDISIKDVSQDNSGFGLTRPYARPGWFTDHLLENFKFRPDCEVIYNGYGMDGCEISYKGIIGHQNPFIAQQPFPADVVGPQSVQISPIKSEKFKATSFNDFFSLLLKGKNGLLWGMEVIEVGIEVYVVQEGAFVFNGEIIENTTPINLNIQNITTNTVVKYDSIAEEITFNTFGSSNSDEFVLSKHIVNDEGFLGWVQTKRMLKTPKVLTSTPDRIFLNEGNEFSFDLYNLGV